LPRIRALVLLFDATDGSPLAIVHGGELTAIRTGAASGAATEILARTASTRAAVFGAGLQARRQLEAVCSVRSIRGARVFDPCGEAAGRFAREMAAALGIPVDVASSPAGALDGADVVCTATTSAVPVFDDRDLAPGAHINAIGSYKPDAREIPAETVERARVVVDSLGAALEEAGDLVLPLREGRIGRAHIETELGEVISGRKEGRRSDGEVTLFKSVGVATQDLAAAARAVERARAMGLGRDVELGDDP
jgi:ornithine cyclodeaminase/alanine dehydrogenase-like protein (mu-crystallin family)